MARIAVTGHLCLDIIPDIRTLTPQRWSQPGLLHEVGPMTWALGGAVANTGIALHRLGMDVALIALCGTDLVGHIIRQQLTQHDHTLDQHLISTPETPSSYSVVVAPHHQDRSFWYFPGTTAVLHEGHILPQLSDCTWLHVGYPPLLTTLMCDDAAPLQHLLATAQSRGLTTSVDMVVPDKDALSGSYDWPAVLTRILPHVDVFVPSAAEICAMLRPADYQRWQHDAENHMDEHYLHALCDQLLTMGVAIAGIKLGTRGLFVKVGTAPRLSHARLPYSWAECHHWQPIYPVTVAGTVGAGDACYAGLIYALSHHLPWPQALPLVAGVAATCVEGVDAVSTIPPWSTIVSRFGTP